MVGNLKVIATAGKHGEKFTLHIIRRLGEDISCPYVVCWNFNGEEWDWGTYFEAPEKAHDCFVVKCKQEGFYLIGGKDYE